MNSCLGQTYYHSTFFLIFFFSITVFRHLIWNKIKFSQQYLIYFLFKYKFYRPLNDSCGTVFFLQGKLTWYGEYYVKSNVLFTSYWLKVTKVYQIALHESSTAATVKGSIHPFMIIANSRNAAFRIYIWLQIISNIASFF